MKKFLFVLFALVISVSAWAEDYKQIRSFDGTISTNTIQRLSDKASIPFAEGNRDYRAYKEWDKTNDAQPADPLLDSAIAENEQKIQAKMRELAIDELNKTDPEFAVSFSGE